MRRSETAVLENQRLPRRRGVYTTRESGLRVGRGPEKGGLNRDWVIRRVHRQCKVRESVRNGERRERERTVELLPRPSLFVPEGKSSGMRQSEE